MLFVNFRRHALHETGLQRQTSFSPLVSSQEQRALFFPLINRGSTACCVPSSVYIGFLFFSCVRKNVQATRLRCLGKYRDARFWGELFCRRPVLPDPALAPRRAPRPHPPVVCLGFGLERCRFLKALEASTWSTSFGPFFRTCVA